MTLARAGHRKHLFEKVQFSAYSCSQKWKREERREPQLMADLEAKYLPGGQPSRPSPREQGTNLGTCSQRDQNFTSHVREG